MSASAFTSELHDQVGGAPELLGRWQLELMRRHGLTPGHRLLDLGCGTLRGGLHFISFLQAGQYVGIDPNEALRTTGLQLVEQAGLATRNPRVETLESLEGPGVAPFDYVISQSVLNHLDRPALEATIARVARVLGDEGWWISTATFSAADIDVLPGARHPVRPNERLSSTIGLKWFERQLAGHGLEFAIDPTARHPRGLDVFAARWRPRRQEARIRARLEELVALDTSPGGRDHGRAASLLGEQLRLLGFRVEVVQGGGRPPLLVARRGAIGGALGSVVLCGHYDVVEPGRGWTSKPLVLTGRGTRLQGLGVADNKGPLAARLAALEDAERGPALVWLIHGEEEVGSESLRAWLARDPPLPGDALWFDEGGWFDESGVQLALAGRLGSGDGVTPLTASEEQTAIRALQVGARRVRVVPRILDKCLVAGGCPFQRALPSGAMYLALGPNDRSTRIHHPDESVPAWGLTTHARQFEGALGLAALAISERDSS